MPTAAEIRSPNSTIRFYKSQLKKFEKLGIGKWTEHNVKITQKLIDTTKKRLNELIIKKSQVR